MPLGSLDTPPARTGRDQYPATVVENVNLCREHWRLVLRIPKFPATRPGQFVQVACRDTGVDYSAEREIDWQEGTPIGPEGQELMGRLAFLRRPFSLAGRRDTAGGVEIDLIQRVVGVGTDWMARLTPGDTVDVLGPLGNAFRLPAESEVALFVGGGVGIPPMLYLASALAGRTGVAFCGALTRDLLPMTITADAAPSGTVGGRDELDVEPLYNVAEFARHGLPAVITTDDGSFGFRGFVTQALERYLDKYFPGGSRGGVRPVVYTCGPEPMMKRVADIAGARGVECQVAVERAMACGMGTCQSCCIRLKRDPQLDGAAFEGKDWIYKLACTDGPVFLGKDLLW
ncbi:MAG: dihydroorotate dehydrogenase electron transfer subunit [Phycisphaerae bacterium]